MMRLLILLLSIIVSLIGANEIYAVLNRVPPAEKQDTVVKLQMYGAARGIKTIQLYGARNEYLSVHFQIAEAHQGSFKVNIEKPGMGREIDFKIYQLCWAPPGAQGLFQADALVPINYGIKPTGRDLEIWTTIKIPAATPPGMYRYNFVFSDNRGTYRQPVDLQVWDFVLPDDLPITILASIHSNGIRHQGEKGLRAQENQSLRAYLSNLREYKINAFALDRFYPDLVNNLKPGKRVEDFPEFHEMLKYMVNDLKCRAFRVPSIALPKNMDEPGPDFIAKAKQYYPLMAEYLKRHHWEHLALIKIVDEPKPINYPKVVQAYSLAKTLAPGIKTESAGRDPDPSLAKVIDIWVMYAKAFNPRKIDEVKKLGQQVWLYANRLHGLDQGLADQRLIGWYLYQYRFPGYLFWGINNWPNDPWSDMPGRNDSLRRGTFVYPNYQNPSGVPFPTTRLEEIRQGFQDYQYLTLFAAAYAQKRIAPATYNEVIRRVEDVTRGLEDLKPEVTMKELEALRYQIGVALDGAQR